VLFLNTLSGFGESLVAEGCRKAAQEVTRGVRLKAGIEPLLGRSPAMRRLRKQITLIARAEGPVLIAGESGTGKELVARAIHRASARAAGPFVAVNCAAIPAELIESELFGHEVGAFTGATERHAGIFEQAHGGSLLLDEIGEMGDALQARLLRVLQEGRVRRVGGLTERTVDVRVLAATHRDVHALLRSGRFRQDLYYRLEAFTLEVPPLRERGDDIELLALHFLRRHAAARGREFAGFDPASIRALRDHAFPGNVRELSNVVARAVAFGRGPDVKLADLPARLRGEPSAPEVAGDRLLERVARDLPDMESLQRRYARLVLEHVGGNKRRAAAILRVSRGTLYRWLRDPKPG
jgi:two-component system, NtrC family, response regulator AtoC